EARVGCALDQPLQALARARIAKPQVDEDFAALLASVREERDVVAVVRQRWGEENLTAALSRRQQSARKCLRPVQDRRLRQVGGVDRFAPIIAQLVQRKTELLLYRACDAERRRLFNNLSDRRVAP